MHKTIFDYLFVYSKYQHMSAKKTQVAYLVVSVGIQFKDVYHLHIGDNSDLIIM